MEQKASYMEQKKKIGWIYFVIFVVFIVLGILFKRIWDMRILLVPCHLIALYFVIGWYRRVFD